MNIYNIYTVDALLFALTYVCLNANTIIFCDVNGTTIADSIDEVKKASLFTNECKYEIVAALPVNIF